MTERLRQEIELLLSRFPELEYREEDQWVLLPTFRMPAGLWDQCQVRVAFHIPAGYPGQKPYGFYVSPRILLRGGGQPNNVTDSNEPPFGGDWRKFSWDAPSWRATADVKSGDNLLNWVLTFTKRLEEGL